MTTEPKIENFLIPLDEIKSATNNFSDANCIGWGGFGKVYKGKLAEFRGIDVAAVKRLHPQSKQGEQEFKTELSVLCKYEHENITRFVGYCDEDGEMIIVSEYAINGSLDKHLRRGNKMCDLTWLQRLVICVGAARGLNHLHSGVRDHAGLIHRDVKSANILLDKNWKARVSDFGLSRFGPEDQPYTHIDTRVAGTMGYCDPYYRGSNILARESDVYSFGVVLFEMLCGRLVNNGDNLNSLNLVGVVWRHRDSLDEIIDRQINDEINPKSLSVFKEIALQCLEFDYRRRPAMSLVLRKLEEALNFQKEHENTESWILKLLQEYEENCYNNKEELYALLSDGVLFDRSKKWFSLSILNGKNCLIISAVELLKERDESSELHVWSLAPELRFMKVAKFQRARDFTHRMQIDTKLLSLNTTYAVLLICKGGLISGSNFCRNGSHRISKLGPEEFRDDDWMEIELFQFVNYMDTAIMEFHIEWYSLKCNKESVFWVQGIQCRPMHMRDHEHDKSWMRKLLQDYEENGYSNKDELGTLLSEGTLFDGSRKWFSLSKNGGNCLIISALELFEWYDNHAMHWSLAPQSRFMKVAEFQQARDFTREMKIDTKLLPLDTAYAVFLICRGSLIDGNNFCHYGKDGMSKLGSSKYRDDGWMEIELFRFINHLDTAAMEFHIEWYSLNSDDGEGSVFLVEGVACRPIDMEHVPDESLIRKLLHEYEENCYNNKEELCALLSEGILFDGGKKFFSLNKFNGKNSVIISARELLKEKDKYSEPHVWTLAPQSRFMKVAEFRQARDFTNKMQINTKLLSFETAYAVFLICRGGLIYGNNFCHWGREGISKLGSAECRDDEWMEIELFQFINNMDDATLEFHIDWYSLQSKNSGDEGNVFQIEGIECRPIEMEEHDLKKQAKFGYEEIIQRSDLPLVYNTKNELLSLLCDGILIDGGTKWFSSTLNGKNSLIISAMEIFHEGDRCLYSWSSTPKSRFAKVADVQTYGSKEIHITTEMLSSETTYAVFIICAYQMAPRIKCYHENTYTRGFLEAEFRDDEWVAVELFHFTNHSKVVTFDFKIEWFKEGSYIEGLEFRPIEMNAEEEYEVGEFPELEDDTDWGQKLPSDYEEILQRASDTQCYTTRKEAYSLLTAGIYLDEHSMWFCLDKSTGKKRIKLSQEKLIVEHGHYNIQATNSRFTSVMKRIVNRSLIICVKIKAQMLSHLTHYAAWLVFGEISFEGGDLLAIASLTLGKQNQQTRQVYILPSSERIHSQKEPDSEQRRRLDRRPFERNDGWMEVELFPFFNEIEDDIEIEIGLQAIYYLNNRGLSLQLEGIEFRPKNIKS